MRRAIYLYILITILLSGTSTASALNINYGSITGINAKNVLIEYFGIEKKQHFLCAVKDYTCTPTKKTTLGNHSVKKETIINTLELEKKRHITLSPNKQFISYYESDEKNKQRTFSLRDLSSNKELKKQETVSYWDLLDEQSTIFRFSPDNTRLIYLDDVDGVLSLYNVPISEITHTGTLTSTKINTSAYSIDDFIVLDTNTLVFVANTIEAPYEWNLYIHNIDTGDESIIAKNVSYASPLRIYGNLLYFSTQEKYGYGPRTYNLQTKKVTAFKIPNIVQTIDLTTQKVMTFNDTFGVMMLPKRQKSYPLVIWLHGGPYRQTSYGYHPFHSYGIYDSILDTLRENGAIVLKLDYKGSLGFGRNYSEAIQGGVGSSDVTDVVRAVSMLKEKYPISNVYLMGNSYGGYLSLKSLVEHPDLFAGALSINGVTDWESLLIKMQTSIFNVQFFGLPSNTNQALYDKASIIDSLDKLPNDKKVLIVQGDSDRTIAPWQATLLYNKMKEKNKNTALLMLKKEDHVLKYKKNITTLCVKMNTFIGMKNIKKCQ